MFHDDDDKLYSTTLTLSTTSNFKNLEKKGNFVRI